MHGARLNLMKSKPLSLSLSPLPPTLPFIFLLIPQYRPESCCWLFNYSLITSYWLNHTPLWQLLPEFCGCPLDPPKSLGYISISIYMIFCVTNELALTLLKHSKPLPCSWLLIVIQLFSLPWCYAQLLRGRHCLGTNAGQIMSNTYQFYFRLQVQRLVIEINGHILNVHFVISHTPTHIVRFYHHNNPIPSILLSHFTESEFKPWEMS